MASRQPGLQSRLMVTFRAEAEEHLQTIADALLALDRGLPEKEAADAIEVVFRAMHTLKGAARSVSLRDLEARCHGLESVLSRVKSGRTPLTREVLDGLQEGARAVAGLVTLLGAPVPAPSGDAAAPAAGPGPPPSHAAFAEPAGRPYRAGTVRVDSERLDVLQTRAEDLLAIKLAAGERVAAARGLAQVLDRGRQGSRQADGRAAEQRARALLDALLNDRRAVTTAVDGLQEEARRLRMMPAGAILEAFPAMVADLSRAQGKEVEWQAAGADMEVDRNILETIRDPLLHLVRNAIDHGIETPPARAAAGKPPRGRITVSFSPLEGRRMEVKVEDDGAGIDLAKVRAAAARARVASVPESEALSESAVLDLVFASGVSTAPVVTDLSGHGLGMAIVRDRVERLGGRVTLETRAGAGSTVRMTLPATVATFLGVLVRAGGRPVLLPIGCVERVLRLEPSQVESVAGRLAVSHQGHSLPVAELAAVLGWPSSAGSGPQHDRKRPCIVVQAAGRTVGFLVEEVLGEREVLVKELAPPLLRVRYVASAGLLGKGELALILRPEDLARGAEERRAGAAKASAATATRPAAILVVDDSITTRTMERNLLESAGYRVEVAADGLEAWTALKSRAFDLVVSDVDMPRLNGFDLTARIRSDPRLADLPVVLVTALESRDDRERGIEVGANAYVIKSGFDQSKLLEIIQRLV
jgi:two-component system chemotaxis sensor kinase CheA